jgi:hypothetical protein
MVAAGVSLPQRTTDVGMARIILDYSGLIGHPARGPRFGRLLSISGASVT